MKIEPDPATDDAAEDAAAPDAVTQVKFVLAQITARNLQLACNGGGSSANAEAWVDVAVDDEDPA